MASAKGVGIPVKLLHEAEGHVVTVELKSGENYRGELIEAEDNWNCQMKNVQATAKVRRGVALHSALHQNSCSRSYTQWLS